MMVKFVTFEINARYENKLCQRHRGCLVANIIFIYFSMTLSPAHIILSTAHITLSTAHITLRRVIKWWWNLLKMWPKKLHYSKRQDESLRFFIAWTPGTETSLWNSIIFYVPYIFCKLHLNVFFVLPFLRSLNINTHTHTHTHRHQHTEVVFKGSYFLFTI